MGSQTIELSVTDNVGNTATETYEFYVSDTSAPKITAKSNTLNVDYGSHFDYKKFVTITDNFDEKVTDVKIEGKVDTKKIGSSKIVLTATDSSGNSTKKEFNVNVADLSAPQLSLTKSRVEVKKGGKINLKDYIKSAQDVKDGNLKSQVKISGSVNTKKTGKYTITYTVKDKAGNTTKKTLKVEVYDPEIKNGAGIIATAKSKLGTPYRWGATGPSSFDCSGFTQWVYKKNGKSIPRTSSAQKNAGTRISISKAKPGDIVWRPGHVGIYVGGGRVIHAPSSGKTVSYTSASGFSCAIRY